MGFFDSVFLANAVITAVINDSIRSCTNGIQKSQGYSHPEENYFGSKRHQQLADITFPFFSLFFYIKPTNLLSTINYRSKNNLRDLIYSHSFHRDWGIHLTTLRPSSPFLHQILMFLLRHSSCMVARQRKFNPNKRDLLFIPAASSSHQDLIFLDNSLISNLVNLEVNMDTHPFFSSHITYLRMSSDFSFTTSERFVCLVPHRTIWLIPNEAARLVFNLLKVLSHYLTVNTNGKSLLFSGTEC